MQKKVMFHEYVQACALVGMIFKAKSMGIEHGVALLLCQKKGEGGISGPKIESVNNDFYGIRTNYFAIAMAKLAVAMRLGVDSGTIVDGLLAGETRYRGCLVRFQVVKSEKWEIYTAFSGGTEDQDVEIAQFGMKMLFPEEQK